jgi:hypothetical protein
LPDVLSAEEALPLFLEGFTLFCKDHDHCHAAEASVNQGLEIPGLSLVQGSLVQVEILRKTP